MCHFDRGLLAEATQSIENRTITNTLLCHSDCMLFVGSYTINRKQTTIKRETEIMVNFSVNKIERP